MKKKFLAILTAALVPLMALCGCTENIVDSSGSDFSDVTTSGEKEVISYKKSMYVFGTDVIMRVYSTFETEEEKNTAISLGTEVADYLEKLEANTSTSYTTSSVYAFNNADAGSTVEIDEDTYNILSIALDIYSETGGYYNAGVYYNVTIFGFGESSSFNGTLPDDSAVTAYTELASSFGNIELTQNDGKYYAVKPDKKVTVDGKEYSLSIDLGGIAKGYAAEEIDGMIKNAGFDYGYINFGSSSMFIEKSATSDDGLWTLTIRDPRSALGDSFMSFRVADTSVSTSGDYENYYTIDGVRFSHIINPVTGYPVNVQYTDGTYSQTAGIISATVLGGSAAENDARTTALMAMGLDEALEYINSDVIVAKNLQIFIVYQTADGSLQLITNVEEDGYTLTNTTDFTLASTIADGKVTYIG